MAKKGKGRAPGEAAAVTSALDTSSPSGTFPSTKPSGSAKVETRGATKNETRVSASDKDAGEGGATVAVATDASQGDDESADTWPDVFVNKWSMHELKTACDDAVKQYLSKPALFQPSHLHTDVRLALGWTSSLLALSGALYAYKLDDFRASRNYVLASVVGYIILSALMALYSRYVEQDTIFKGKRKVFAGRIETQQLHVRTSCPSPYEPVYQMTMSYHHSSNGGKTLIAQTDETFEIPFNEVFDVDGKLHRPELERRIQGVLDKALAG